MWQLLINSIILSNIVPILTQSNQTCPKTCSCSNLPCETLDSVCYKTTVRCESWNSSFNLPNTTVDLEVSYLDKNNLCVFLNTLGELQLLKSLVIQTSEVENNKCLQNFPETVNNLKLSQNNLTVLPQFSFNTSLLLKTLDLSQNYIKLVGKIGFLKTLETLNLSGNSISEIKSNSFKSLETLKILDLSRNNLSTLNKELFQHLTTLKLLNLSYNNIRVLQQSSFGDLLSLEQLDFSFNKLIKVNLESLDLPNLTTLYLTGNKQVGKLNNFIAGTSKKLKFVDASNTGEENIPGVLTQSVRTLKLAKNNIKSINSGELDAYPLLQLLDLSSNKIEIIQEDSLGRLEFLIVLCLQDNNIKEIPRTLPEQMIILYLQSNNIPRVNKDDLRGMSSLEVLNLRDNKITSIEEQALSNLTSLAALDLSENPISILSPNSLSGPLSLQTLRLSAVGTISPAKDVSFPLLSPENLVLLDLSHSAGLARQMLNDEAFLDAVKQLQELDLSDTGLESIRSDLLYFLPQLRVLHIRNNQLNCSGLEWLASWMRRQDNSDYRLIICAKPTYLRGLPLVDLQYAETPSIKPINQVGAPINQARKSGTTTYQVGQYNVGQKTSYKITMNGKNYDNERIIDGLSKENNTQLENKSQNKNKDEVGETTTKKSEVNLKNQPDSRSKEIDKKLYIVLPAQNLSKTSGLDLVNTDQLNTKFKNNKTHLNCGISADKNNISSMECTQNPQHNQTKALNNTKVDALSLNVTESGLTRSKASANAPSWSTNLWQNGFNNKTKPLSGERNNLNQDKEGSHINIETPKSETNLISTYQVTDVNKFRKRLTSSNKAFTNMIRKNENTINRNLTIPSEVTTKHNLKSETKSNFYESNASHQPKLSMYKHENPKPSILHPGIIFLTAGVLSGLITLIFLATKIRKDRRTSNSELCREDSENIEVSEVATIPNVTELW